MFTGANIARITTAVRALRYRCFLCLNYAHFRFEPMERHKRAVCLSRRCFRTRWR
jgi:hypothetical protein